MKTYIKTLLIGSFVGAGLMHTSCSDILDKKPIDYFSQESYWGSKTEFEGFITAMSQMFRANYPANILFYAGEQRAGGFEQATIDGSGIYNSSVIQNIYDESNNYQFTNFAGYPGFIANLNELIYRCNNTDVLDEETKNGLLGIAYGWRAYSFFQIYRMYGGAVLRLEPDVTLGIYDPTQLYMARSTAEETLTQIKSDIQTSLDYFNSTDYVFNSSTKDYYWSKAATEMLAGEVYLWSGKVTTDDHTATPADVATAATYFNNVINNYGYELMDDYFEVWTTSHNSESIYSICYTSENDGVYYSYPPYYTMWARITGTAYNNYWSTQDKEGWGHVKGVANRFGNWYDTATGTSATFDIWNNCNFGPMRIQYKNALYFQYDEDDSRIDMFYPLWKLTEEESEGDVKYLDDFDPKAHDLFGVFVCKFRPKRISSSDYYAFANDMPIYRLALAYMYAAECANYAGDNATVEKYINAIRKRAYGDKWDESKHGYTAGSFAENENAIMREKDKEFIMEGQRWWDLRRLTVVKDGTQRDHFVFQPQGCIGYGLDPVANPWMIDINGNPIETDVSVLNGTTQDEHLLLWPLDEDLLGSDSALKDQQNPGYVKKEEDKD
ncbi:MAG: RagB/SusD family nutrient uptake outer membrane protein [Bacteroidales bacterium]|nr:RagB/SusD family nutrient uptake outer membrane protein [Bacteroidales bacterium]